MSDTQLVSKLQALLQLSITHGMAFKYIPDDEGDGYSIFIGEKCFYSADEALEFING